MPKSYGEEGFDVQTLSNLGFGKEVAEFFDKVRYLPGRQQVTIEVNATDRYLENVRFDEQGELCLEPELVETLSLKLDIPLEGCPTVATAWPEAQIAYFPGDFRVALTLPERAFDAEKLRGELRGGYAALLSYDLYSSQIRMRNNKQQTLQAMLSPGVNVKNWVIRNRSNYSQNESGRQLRVMETYAQREIAGGAARLQLGEFGAAGSLNAGLPMTGLQLYSGGERADGVQLAVPVEGIAQTQSTVEVRQRGQTVYRTMISPGLFSLTQLGGAVGGIETEIDVIGSDGQRQRFTVTPVSGGGDQGNTGGQVAIGRYRSYDSASSGMPLLLLGEKHWRPAPQQNVGVGGLVAGRYQNLSWRWGMTSESGHWLSAGGVYARGRRKGAVVDVQGQLALGANVSLSAFSQFYSRGYRGADQALSGIDTEESGNPRISNSLSLSWATPRWGSLSYSLSKVNQYSGNNSLAHLFSYGVRLKQASLNLSLRSSDRERAALYASISLPLGGGSVNTRLQSTRNNSLTLGSSWQGEIGDDIGVQLDVNRDSEGQYGFGGALSGQTAYSRLGVNGTRSGSGNSSLSLSASGALGVANGTWVTSPSQAGDSMAVVRVPDQSGINLYSSGRGITDFSGTALLPALPAGQPLTITVDTRRLPLNVRLDSTSSDLKLAYGSVASRQFRAAEVRQLLLTVRDSEGRTLPLGASVHDPEGNFMGTLVGDGNLLLINDDIGKALRIRRVNREECRLRYSVPEHFDANMLYEEGDAVCLVDEQTPAQN
ncbi:fimbria/pilus outer membrane usher protein [Serratia sp. IR-2025]